MNSTLTLTRSFHGKPLGIRAFLISIQWNLQKVHHYHMLIGWWICVTHYHFKHTAPSAIKFQYVYVCEWNCTLQWKRQKERCCAKYSVTCAKHEQLTAILNNWLLGTFRLNCHDSVPFCPGITWALKCAGPVSGAMGMFHLRMSWCSSGRNKQRKRHLEARPFCVSVI